MNILAFVDTHEDPDAFPRFKKIIKKEKVDIVCCIGDFTIFGRDTKSMLKQMNEFGVPVMLIHGNHEDEDEIVPLMKRFKNLHWCHGTFVDVLGIRFFGFGGHGFRNREPELEELEEEHADGFTENTVVLCHAPPYETTLDEADEGWHVGNESLNDLITRRKPMLVLCGHIHQCFHARDTVGKTLCINPGPDGEIIEVDV